MQRARLLLILSGLLLVTFAGTATAKGEQSLTGAYVWDDGDAAGDLRAVFTPTGEDMWDVSFYFTFQGQPHTYTGTATGSLTNGDLEGKVLTDSKRRTFVFEGTFKNGEFHGTHAEFKRDQERRLGTLTLTNKS